MFYFRLVEDIWKSNHNNRAYSPKSMVANIRQVGKQFHKSRQEDAHEYLVQLLDCMHEEILKLHSVKTSEGKIAETTLISRIFGGYLCNEMKCSKCSHSSKTYNYYQHLSLDINNGVSSINNSLKSFTKIETLTQGNEWLCEKCKQKVKATKQLTISQLSNVMILHLKRFSYGNMNGKVSKHIDFDLEQYFTEQNGLKVKYNLTGIVVHHGNSTHSGHYIAFVKAPNGQWYEMDDSSVSVCQTKRLLQQQAYILFYSRDGPKESVNSPPMQNCSNNNSADSKSEVTNGLKSVSIVSQNIESKSQKGKRENTVEIKNSASIEPSIPLLENIEEIGELILPEACRLKYIDSWNVRPYV